ncbi:hypothetical protein, partial [Streptomyces sp. NPDC003395]
AGNGQSGGLSTYYDGPRPNAPGYRTATPLPSTRPGDLPGPFGHLVSSFPAACDGAFRSADTISSR